MKILNLYAGIGGNRRMWGDDHHITAVELEPKIATVYRNNFQQDAVIETDAHQYLLDHYKEFDFIWSSPPCQTHSRMMKATRHDVAAYFDLSLYQEIIFLKHFFSGKWVVENVVPYYDPLIPPTRRIGRHLYWSNFRITGTHEEGFENFIQADTKAEMDTMKKRLGIHFEGNIYYGDNHSPGQILRNCVMPETGLHILNCANNVIEPAKSGTLF